MFLLLMYKKGAPMQSVQTDCSVRPDALIFPVVSGISGSFCLGLVLGSSFLRLYGFRVILAEQQALVFVQFLLAAVQVKCHSSQRTSHSSQNSDHSDQARFFIDSVHSFCS